MPRPRSRLPRVPPPHDKPARLPRDPEKKGSTYARLSLLAWLRLTAVPPGVVNREHEAGPEFEALLHRIDERDAEEARRGIRAWLLAPSIDIYLALMRGEQVPAEQLNQDALQRYGRKAA